MTTTPRRKATWLGVPGTAWEVLSAGKLGKRVSLIEWPNGNPNVGATPGQVSATVITGDGRKANHVIHAKAVLNPDEVSDFTQRHL